jgi:hypothetical protein
MDALGEIILLALFSRAGGYVLAALIFIALCAGVGAYVTHNQLMQEGNERGFVGWCEGRQVWAGDCSK